MERMINNDAVETINYAAVFQVDQSMQVPIQQAGEQLGVRELARMFSARSKEQVFTDKAKRSPSSSPVKLQKPLNDKLSSSLDTKSTVTVDPRYQNVFADPRFVAKAKNNPEFQINNVKGKKPVPTPRKTYSPEGVIGDGDDDDSSDDDGYTPMSTTIAELNELKNEIDLLQNIAKMPSLHSKANQPGLLQIGKGMLVSSSGYTRVGFVSPVERKRVLDAGGKKGNVTVGFSLSDISDDDESGELYLPILPDTKLTNGRFNNDVVHRRLTTDSISQKQLLAINWERTQGSLFAEEMINMIDDDTYYQIPVSKNKKIRESSHSYMEINDDRLRSFGGIPLRVVSTTSLEPVYIQAEEGCEEYVHPEIFSTNPVETSTCPVTPPNVFPKSKSLLREQERCSVDPPPKEMETINELSNNVIVPLRTKKSEKLINVFKPSAFGLKKKKKQLTHVISSPRLPLYPPNRKASDSQLDKSLSSSEFDFADLSSSFGNPGNDHSNLSVSVSRSPSPLATIEDTPFDDSPVESDQSLTSIKNTYTQPILRRTLSESVVKNTVIITQRQSSTTSLNSSIHEHQSNDEEPLTHSLLVTNRIRSNTGAPRLKLPEETGLPSSFGNKRVLGYFTCQGGTLASRESGVHISIPPDAVPKGKRQKIWFEILQTMHKEGSECFMDSITMINNCKEVEHPNQVKKDSAIQLSLTVVVGPMDVVLNKPIKVFIPHCAMVDSTMWNLKVIGRASQSDDWEQLIPSNNFMPSLPKQKKYKNSTYKIYPDSFRVKTRHVGCFRMTGKPVGQNLPKLTKKMVSSVYCQKMEDEIRIKIFITNSFLDSVETLYHVMLAEGYTCIERNIPIMCSGNHSDLKVSLMMETNRRKVATCMQMIPFEMFWRATRIGNAVATFDLSCDELANNKVLKIKLYQREGSQQEFEVLLPN